MAPRAYAALAVAHPGTSPPQRAQSRSPQGPSRQAEGDPVFDDGLTPRAAVTYSDRAMDRSATAWRASTAGYQWGELSWTDPLDFSWPREA